MNQQTGSETRDAGLTTADLAHTNAPTSPANAVPTKETNRPDERARATNERSNGPDGPERAHFSSEAARAESASRKHVAGSTAKNSEEEYGATPLLNPEEAAEFHTHWDAVQVSFVDEPRHAVEQADSLVASAIKRLAEVFAKERAQLDSQWDRGESVSTEDLRVALRRYRSFFGRLLSI